MKKALIVLTICMLTNPAFAATCKTKACKKAQKRHQQKIVYVRKKATQTPAAEEVVQPQEKQKVEEETKEKKNWSLENFSGNFDFASNYVFRGISQTTNLPAVQGGITYSFPIGLYFNAWGSNVKFFDFNGNQATVELDTIAGWRGSFLNDNISYDINVDRYNYPGARFANYNELNTLWVYKILQLGFSYSGNAYNTHKTGLYYNGTITLPIPPRYAFGLQDLNFLAEYGHYSLPRAAGNSYNDYSATLNKKISDIYTFTLQWTDTDGRQHLSPYDSSQILGMVTANF